MITVVIVSSDEQGNNGRHNMFPKRRKRNDLEYNERERARERERERERECERKKEMERMR